MVKRCADAVSETVNKNKQKVTTSCLGHFDGQESLLYLKRLLSKNFEQDLVQKALILQREEI